MNLIGFLCLVSSTNAFLTQNERHRIIGPVPAIDSRRQTVSLYPKDDQRILTLTYHHTQLSVRGGGSDDDVSSSIEKAKAFVSKSKFQIQHFAVSVLAVLVSVGVLIFGRYSTLVEVKESLTALSLSQQRRW